MASRDGPAIQLAVNVLIKAAERQTVKGNEEKADQLLSVIQHLLGEGWPGLRGLPRRAIESAGPPENQSHGFEVE